LPCHEDVWCSESHCSCPASGHRRKPTAISNGKRKPPPSLIWNRRRPCRSPWPLRQGRSSRSASITAAAAPVAVAAEAMDSSANAANPCPIAPGALGTVIAPTKPIGMPASTGAAAADMAADMAADAAAAAAAVAFCRLAAPRLLCRVEMVAEPSGMAGSAAPISAIAAAVLNPAVAATAMEPHRQGDSHPCLRRWPVLALPTPLRVARSETVLSTGS
jgi:hypothetical protein